MFPIRNSKGQVIAFGGRVLGDDKPKYLNSPETTVFHKGRELYGLYEARRANRQLTRMIIVEGYMDVIALAQAGISNAVATLGTACNASHLTRLFRLVNEVIFCFDGDEAGRTAAWRALQVSIPLL
ncbi:MAG: toprim domain-containing protein, partial [Pseudomonadales bacterium]|nr:toprim domain-containing protein [Pseudomonadales bacterium]